MKLLYISLGQYWWGQAAHLGTNSRYFHILGTGLLPGGSWTLCCVGTRCPQWAAATAHLPWCLSTGSTAQRGPQLWPPTAHAGARRPDTCSLPLRPLSPGVRPGRCSWGSLPRTALPTLPLCEESAAFSLQLITWHTLTTRQWNLSAECWNPWRHFQAYMLLLCVGVGGCYTQGSISQRTVPLSLHGQVSRWPP